MRNRAFTLTEVIIVVAMIGILAAVAMPRFGENKEQVIAASGLQALTSYIGAMERYKLDKDVYPSDCTLLDLTETGSDYFDVEACTAAGQVTLKRTTKLYSGTQYVLTGNADTSPRYCCTNCPDSVKTVIRKSVSDICGGL
jgi:prepilin-type N-terminal cleavage/methylation domain-containing protein